MRKALILIVGVVALGLVGFGWSLTRAVGLEVTDCGFDAKGAYANVRVDNLLGFSARDQRVGVTFSMKNGRWRGNDTFPGGIARVNVPAHSRGTALVQAHFPPHGSFLGGTHEDLHVPGRTVYRFGDGLSGRYVSRRFVMTHRDPVYQNHIYIETVPDDTSALRCRAFAVSDEENDD